MSRIFIVGATGHIGGAVLELLYGKYPDVKIRALVRDEEKGETLRGKYRRVETVLGDNGSLDVLEREAKEADVVLNTGPDVRQDAAIAALLRGLSNRTSKPYYIHTSGAALIWDEPNGKPNPKIWDDVEDIQEMQSLPSSYVHATPDALVFSHSPSIHTAIVSPTMVYGLSPSLIHPTPVTLPMALTQILRLSHGFTVSTGANLQAYIHVLDLARLYLLLLDHALSPSSPNPNSAPFGPQSYYFAAGEELTSRTYMTHLVQALLPHHDVVPLESKEIVELDPPGLRRSKLTRDADLNAKVLFGMNMRVRCTRAEKVLGWKAVEKGVLEGLEEVVGVWVQGEKQKRKEKKRQQGKL
ncbi:hypothetical protein ACMFMG_008555 [Clarireedia jacksonii]